MKDKNKTIVSIMSAILEFPEEVLSTFLRLVKLLQSKNFKEIEPALKFFIELHEKVFIRPLGYSIKIPRMSPLDVPKNVSKEYFLERGINISEGYDSFIKMLFSNPKKGCMNQGDTREITLNAYTTVKTFREIDVFEELSNSTITLSQLLYVMERFEDIIKQNNIKKELAIFFVEQRKGYPVTVVVELIHTGLRLRVQKFNSGPGWFDGPIAFKKT